MSKASGLGDNEDWENCGGETLFDKISSITPQAFITKYTNVNIALEQVKAEEKNAFILAMVRNPKLYSFVLELKYSSQVSPLLWHTIYQQVQDEHIPITNGWVTKLLKDKSDAYSYVITNQPKVDEVEHLAEYSHESSWGIWELIGSIFSFSFLTTQDNQEILGDNVDIDKTE